MPGSSEWSVAPADQPSPEDYEFDLDRVLSAVVGLKANIPPDAFTADVLGTERSGQGVFIEGGVVLTIGYLITEASSIWLSLADGRVVPGHVLGYDQETGFGLVQPLARLDQVGLPLGRSADVKPGDRVVVAGAAAAATPSRPASSASRSSPATGNMSWTRRSSRRRRTPTGAARPRSTSPAR